MPDNAPPDPLGDIIRQIAEQGNALMEDRIHHALAIAGTTMDYVRDGRAWVARVVDNHSECGRTGIVRTLDTTKNLATVAICPCLEIRVATCIRE